MIELPENAQHPQKMLRTPMMMAVIAVMISLFPLLFACSSEGSKDQAGGGRQTDEGRRAGATRGGQTAGDGSKGARSTETQAALVPIAHLSSTRRTSARKSSRRREIWPSARESREEAGELVETPEVRELRFRGRRGRPREQDA